MAYFHATHLAQTHSQRPKELAPLTLPQLIKGVPDHILATIEFEQQIEVSDLLQAVRMLICNDHGSLTALDEFVEELVVDCRGGKCLSELKCQSVGKLKSILDVSYLMIKWLSIRQYITI